MKAITLHRPWDQAILHADKRYENRPWKLPENMLGRPIALHAGKKYDLDGAEWMFGMGLHNSPDKDDSPEGIVGIVYFDKVVSKDDDIDDIWFSGPYGWHISKVIRLREPISCKGAQRLWNVPENIVKAIQSQLIAQILISQREGHTND